MARNVYNLDFKKKVLKEAEESNNTAAVARKYGVNVKLLYKWKSSFSKVTGIQLIEPTSQPHNTENYDLQVILLQMKEIQQKLDHLSSVGSQDQFMADIAALTTRMEYCVMDTLMKMQGQFAVMMRNFSQMNNRADDNDMLSHSKSNTTNNLPPSMPRPTNNRKR
ncbi:transposase [Paenibacillus sp. FSL L8-0333]|uniref:transposase n=1 Tax=unclassified Paenibacillus TaxID=185978 RepID=UPI0030CEB1BC